MIFMILCKHYGIP